MSDPFLYEFLYRGRPASGPGAGEPAWHAVIGQFVSLPGKSSPQFVATEPLTPDQAAAAGFPLSAVVSGLNAAALADRDAKTAALVEMTKARDEAMAELDALKAALPADPAAAQASDAAA